MQNIEHRNLFGHEVRAEGEGDARKIIGLAAVFYREGDPGTQYQLWSGAVERIHPGAFDRTLREDDIRGLFNHSPSLILGRNKAGTMTLLVDTVGLRYEITPGKTSVAADLIDSIDRGDVSGSSFGFRAMPKKVEWTTEKVEGIDIEVRNIYEAQVYDVGPVTFPAYTGTDAAMRSIEEVRGAREEWNEQRSSQAAAQMRERIRKLRISA